MDDSDIGTISCGKSEEATKILQDYTLKNAQTFVFLDLVKENKRKRLWEAVFIRLSDPSSSKDCILACLDCLRLLSRDKTGLNDVLQDKWIASLLKLSGLNFTEESSQENLQTDNDVTLEGQKCLSNLIFNSDCVQAWCSASSSPFLASLVRRLRDHPRLPYQIRLFDFKLLFLITAVCEETRVRVREELRGIIHLTEALEKLLPHPLPTDWEMMQLNAETTNLCCELLKVMFNISEGARDRVTDEEEEAQLLKLVTVLRALLLCQSEQQEDLRSHCIHLLMAVPPSCYAGLMPHKNSEVAESEELDMRTLNILMDMLEKRLQGLSPEASTSKKAMEQLCPLLTILAGGALVQRPLRKYVRTRVLPPLKEVHLRPEETNSLRGALCRLLTCPVSPVRDLAADLLFVLCKESVARMVKHTGYGNCAGLLANRGLMLGGRGDKGHYSSESEDSDTEEYKEHRDHINPVIGCYEPPRPDPLANMSEEQQEYEAMQLVKMMDKLTRGGVVQPCRIGEDGRPEPLEHILQLQESNIGAPNNFSGDQSDSD